MWLNTVVGEAPKDMVYPTCCLCANVEQYAVIEFQNRCFCQSCWADMKMVFDRHKARTYVEWSRCIPEPLKDEANMFMKTYNVYKPSESEAYNRAIMFGITSERKKLGRKIDIVQGQEFAKDIVTIATNMGNSINCVQTQGLGCYGAYIEGVLHERERIY